MQISRRGVLRGFAAAVGVAGVSLVAGCDLFGSKTPQVTPPPAGLTTFLASTVALGDAYDAALPANPALAGILTPIRDAHRAHARALAQAIGVSAPQATTTATGGGDAASLKTAETKAHDDAVTLCLATEGRYAQVIGTIAAARACHLEVLP